MERHAGRARIYLSFAEEDRPRVMELVRWLNDGGWKVHADHRHAFPADDAWTWARPISLDTSEVVLCAITLAWLASESCRYEFSYAARHGKFVLPVICEAAVIEVLPPALRALPRVDLTQGRLVDYLKLKDTLSQAGSKIAAAAVVKRLPAGARTFAGMLGQRYFLWVALAAASSIAAIWLWLRP
jgi:TIR domain